MILIYFNNNRIYLKHNIELNYLLLDKDFNRNIMSLIKTKVYYDTFIVKKCYNMHYSHKRK
jgi:hypothetical protein